MAGRSAFTLIELLVVVAIIAILAAIAVVNFLEAQTRSKVTRVAADQRTMVVALSCYSSDTGHLLPIDPASPVFAQTQLHRLTTPIAYITALPTDAFWPSGPGDANDPEFPWFAYVDMQVTHELGLSEASDMWEQVYLFVSRGPDIHFDANDSQDGGMLYDLINDTYHSVYDPTNGTVSSGDLFRGQEGMIGGGAFSNAGGF